MQTRTEPIPVPDVLLPPWFVVDVPGRGPHHFRSLSPIKTMRFFRDLGHKDGVIKVETDADKMGEAVDRWTMFGAAIGLCWAHQTLELLAGRNDFATLAEYGEAVSDELHAYGYTTADQNVLAAEVMVGMGGLSVSSEEVQTRAGFSEPQEAGTN
jgi:hypothetical protein